MEIRDAECEKVEMRALNLDAWTSEAGSDLKPNQRLVHVHRTRSSFSGLVGAGTFKASLKLSAAAGLSTGPLSLFFKTSVRRTDFLDFYIGKVPKRMSGELTLTSIK